MRSEVFRWKGIVRKGPANFGYMKCIRSGWEDTLANCCGASWVGLSNQAATLVVKAL